MALLHPVPVASRTSNVGWLPDCTAVTLVLTLKLLLAPCLVVASSLAGRRWGPRLAGILVTLPVVAGPILLIVYLEHGAAFAGRAAAAATLGVVPLALYVVVFALASSRFGWATSLLASWLSVVVADLVLVWVDVPAGVALVLAVLALAGANRVLRRMEVSPPPRSVPPWWDLPARAAATGALVLLVTGLSDVLGPVWTGVLTPFPIALSVVCAFAAAHDGHDGLVAVLRGVVPGLNGFALFCFTVAVCSEPLGGLAAIGIATGIAVLFALALARGRRQVA